MVGALDMDGGGIGTVVMTWTAVTTIFTLRGFDWK
jgi:hypothetical protein